MTGGTRTVRYASGMATKRGSASPTRDPDRYISNNLRQSAWDALTDLQKAARRAGLNPSKSAVLIAAGSVITAHLDELIANLKEADK